MPANDRLTEFAAVVGAGSISAAARTLALPRATLSRRITALESELGVRLLHRSTRRLVLTPAGEELDRRARRIVADAEEAWRAVRRLDDVPRGLLRVSAHTQMLGDLFVSFLQPLPEIELEVRSTTRHVDLIQEGVDVAVRFGLVKDPNVVARRVGPGRRVVVGSREYLAAHGRPTTPAQLRDHACMVDFAGDALPSRSWPLLAGGSVRVKGPLAANDVSLALRSAKAGLGLALIPQALVTEEIANGSLVVVLEDSVGADAGVSVVYADREYIEPKVRVFVDRAVAFLSKRFAARA
jgi:DNA-binding transcriptional LysR family regulator